METAPILRLILFIYFVLFVLVLFRRLRERRPDPSVSLSQLSVKKVGGNRETPTRYRREVMKT
jgi:hypothetical protein